MIVTAVTPSSLDPEKQVWPENLLKMQNDGPFPEPTESEPEF